MTDYIIIGGGIYGCGVAHELAQRGADVLLLEANTIASGASGGLGKRGVRANGRDRRELPLMRMAYELWPTLHEVIDAPTGYERVGHLDLIERPQDLDKAPAQAWMQEQQGIPTRLIDGAELRTMEPWLNEDVVAALYCPLDGIADHTATTRGMAQSAMRHGAEFCEKTAVVSFEREGSQISAVITSNEERIPVGKQVLLLSNSHVVDLLQHECAITLPIWQLLPQVMLTGVVDPMPLNHLIGHMHRTLAMKANPDGRIMISGGWRGKWNAVLGRGETQPDQVEGNRVEAAAVYPCLVDVGIAEADASRIETVTIDDIPIIDRVPSIENAIFATGWSGHGWAIAPAVAQLLADWALTGVVPPLLAPFSYSRFSASA